MDWSSVSREGGSTSGTFSMGMVSLFSPPSAGMGCAKRRAGTQNGEEKDGLVHARKRDQAC